MNFQRDREKEHLEINLVPMIDVMLVILIFLMITTTTGSARAPLARLSSAASCSTLTKATGVRLTTYWPCAFTSTATSLARSSCFSASAAGRLICSSVYFE